MKLFNFFHKGNGKHECRLPLTTAYACLYCRTIQNGANHGTCRQCESQLIVSVSAEIKRHLQEVRHRWAATGEAPMRKFVILKKRTVAGVA